MSEKISLDSSDMIYLFNTYLISLVSKYATYLLSLTN